MQHNTHHAGFTLIEALVAIAIAAIILGIAVPNFQDFMRNTRVTSQTNDFVLALALAKSEAVKRNRPVIVCSSSNSTSCASSVNWHSGWIVYEDSDGDGTVDANEILQVRGTLEGGSTFTTPTVQSLTFLNTGYVRDSAAAFNSAFAPAFTSCTSGTTTGRRVTLSALGYAQNLRIETCP